MGIETDNGIPVTSLTGSTTFSTTKIDYKYSEDKFMNMARNHIDSTYGKHYSGEIQTVEYIMSKATSLDYLVGNVMKYMDRFGKKNGYNVEDLHKAVHYISMMAFYSEQKFKK